MLFERTGCGAWSGWTAAVVAAVLTGVGLAAPVQAQHESPSRHAEAGSDEVKTLTPAEVADLRAGAGMGMARPAELNGLPGPRHVLDLADSLRLTAPQRRQVEAVFEEMSEAARELGARIIEAEKTLDRAFAAGAEPETLEAVVTDVASLRGALRWTHLRAHLRTAEILSPHQRHEYDRLRGYGEHGG